MVEFNSNLNLNGNFGIRNSNRQASVNQQNRTEGSNLLAGKSNGDVASFSRTASGNAETENTPAEPGKTTTGFFSKIGNFFKGIFKGIANLFKREDKVQDDEPMGLVISASMTDGRGNTTEEFGTYRIQ